MPKAANPPTTPRARKTSSPPCTAISGIDTTEQHEDRAGCRHTVLPSGRPIDELFT
jgi:hypothetical protein